MRRTPVSQHQIEICGHQEQGRRCENQISLHFGFRKREKKKRNYKPYKNCKPPQFFLFDQPPQIPKQRQKNKVIIIYHYFLQKIIKRPALTFKHFRDMPEIEACFPVCFQWESTEDIKLPGKKNQQHGAAKK